MYMMVYAVHLLETTVHPSEAPDLQDRMCSTLDPVHLLAIVVHPSEAPDEHMICSTLNCKCSTPKWGSRCTVYDCLYSNVDGKCSTIKWGS